ncbi:hypothetical protein SERLA73DRAFT_177369 [Serpula lacrymans var. lacrymans S7.3]|uniref:Uncharacterized protein n=2 Tax=Serpula lacrymans var. lacrymans TaxID=341189 RepID=F8PNW2_SERL3|nr:uncharacterized protein SERLADRAFT_460929 [Serpula lacrymans var. lacrymans S7.9]EGO01839.1 hypothetical protein SERLA73DRAFT_177369 [Serpula lacrymans var. lacrymans S7.3]EGO27466.1 hypothetical protein SERLADRAFT_460929 [Serpula lacrymans var. lacrymans S7.9]
MWRMGVVPRRWCRAKNREEKGEPGGQARPGSGGKEGWNEGRRVLWAVTKDILQSLGGRVRERVKNSEKKREDHIKGRCEVGEKDMSRALMLCGESGEGGVAGRAKGERLGGDVM